MPPTRTRTTRSKVASASESGETAMSPRAANRTAAVAAVAAVAAKAVNGASRKRAAKASVDVDQGAISIQSSTPSKRRGTTTAAAADGAEAATATPKAKRYVTAKSVNLPAEAEAALPTPAPTTASSSTAPSLSTPYQPTLLPAVLSFALPAAQAHLQTRDPRFSLFFRHLPCRPFVHLEAIDPFRTLVTSIIGQQVSWMAAKAINGRFRALFGYEDEKEGFPTPEMVEREDVLRLKSVGLSLRKAEYVVSLAQHFTSGQLSTELLRDGTDEQISKALIAVRGIGQWTVDMFLMFSLRRPDVLPVGDLGVQKGLLRWALSAHDALPKKTKGTPKKGKKSEKSGQEAEVEVVEAAYVDSRGEGEVDTLVREREKTPMPLRRQGDALPLPLPPTPLTPSTSTTAPSGSGSGLAPSKGVLRTPNMPMDMGTNPKLPPTPASPSLPNQVLEVPSETLPPPTCDEMLAPPDQEGWDAHRAVPLAEGLSVDVLKARLSGKKVKGGMYLTPREMEVLTEGWRPYRSLGVFYMWPAAEEQS